MSLFFVLSKVLYGLIQPINWIILTAFLAFKAKNPKRQRYFLGLTLGLLLFLTNPFISYRIFKLWEGPSTPMHTLRDTFDIGLVLGGFSAYNEYADDHRFNLGGSSGNRLIDAISLYKKGVIRHILISGGDGRLLGDPESEALKTKPFLLSLGIPDSAILLETGSKNTHENALFSAPLCANKSVLLITSAFHMRRGLGCCYKQGVYPTPFPTSFVAEPPTAKPDDWLLPNPQLLTIWQDFIKEWIGYAVYTLKGYI